MKTNYNSVTKSIKLIGISVTAFLLLGVNGMAQEAEMSSDSTKSDTSRFSIGSTKVIIISDDKNDSKNDDTESISIKKEEKQRWNHYVGVDFGINGLLSEKKSVDLPEEARFMDLDYARSVSISLNFFEHYIPIAKEKFGISTGLGFEFNKYALDRDYTILANKDSTFGFQDSSIVLSKNLFKSEVLNWPIMLETNLGKDAKHSFHVAVGGMLSYRLGAKTKQIFTQDNKEYKVKNRTDYNTNPFLFSLVARVGYGGFTIFANYSLTPMFENNKGPELYPFTVGVSLASF
ncbi:MAG: outer membrane beta-barrel protein [Vicingaceae bacterium]